jgi:hypothetical protein
MDFHQRSAGDTEEYSFERRLPRLEGTKFGCRSPHLMDPSTRHSQTTALFGREFSQKIRNTRVLVVGSGGIGCELRRLVLSDTFYSLLMQDKSRTLF